MYCQFLGGNQYTVIQTTFRKSVNILLHFFWKVNPHYFHRQRKTS
nr:MAG TPA: hypothetical protein [Caudoviricetes sp.]